MEVTQSQKQFSFKLKPFLKEGLIYIIFLVAASILFLFIKPEFSSIRNGVFAQCFIAISLVSLVVAGYVFYRHKKLDFAHIIVLLIIAGAVVRIGYMLYTPSSVRQYDTWTMNNDGHEAYAWTIYSTGKLPNSNVYQFYHPPLNAIIQAMWMHFTNGFTSLLSDIFKMGSFFPDAFLAGKPIYANSQRYFLYSTTQILSAFYSFVIAIFSLKTLKLFKMSKQSFFVAAVVVIFFPRMIQLSGQLNNDSICSMFSIMGVYYCLLWWKQGKKTYPIIMCSISIGLAMMSKLTGAVVCLPIAVAFIYEFIRTLKKKEGSLPLSKMIIQYVSFLLICAPIGLWFQVYANVRFGQSFGHVFSNLNPSLDTSSYSFFERFIVTFDLHEIFGDLFCKAFDNYYIPAYIIKSSIFGEFTYWQGESFALLAVILAFLVVIVMAVLFVRYLVDIFKNWKKESGQEVKEERENLLFISTFLLALLGSVTYFNLQMPYGCTMDFRYMIPIVLCFALLIALVFERLDNTKFKFSKPIKNYASLMIVIMMASSTLFYCVCI